MKSWVGSITYRAYMSTSCANCADTKLLGIDTNNSFKAKKEKTPDILKSDFHILELKKHRAQAEVEMFSEAIACTAGPWSEDGELASLLQLSHTKVSLGMCSSYGPDRTYESCLPNNSSDDWFDDGMGGFSTSSASSNASAFF
jgi:hypothetical protein